MHKWICNIHIWICKSRREGEELTICIALIIVELILFHSIRLLLLMSWCYILTSAHLNFCLTRDNIINTEAMINNKNYIK